MTTDKSDAAEWLYQMSYSFMTSRVLSAGIQLRVFSHVAAGKKTVAEIADAAQASERGMSILLEALVACDLLEKHGERYELEPLCGRFLVRGSPDYLGFMLEADVMWEAMKRLPDVVRSGKPLNSVEDQATAEKFFPMLVRSLHIVHWERAKEVAKALGVGTALKGLEVLDVACGSAVFGIAAAAADATARVTAHDYPGVLAVARELAARHAVEKQFDFLPGDLKAVDFGKQRWDLALLGNILHSEGERSSRELLARLHASLKPHGRVAIIEMVPGEDRTSTFPALFGLSMLLNTREGNVFTLAQYATWLKDSGFLRVEVVDIGSHSPLIIGHA